MLSEALSTSWSKGVVISLALLCHLGVMVFLVGCFFVFGCSGWLSQLNTFTCVGNTLANVSSLPLSELKLGWFCF